LQPHGYLVRVMTINNMQSDKWICLSSIAIFKGDNDQLFSMPNKLTEGVTLPDFV
jgi:hypothetical protein